MKKRANGFTLIELLAVIVTLGIILAIAVPAITGLISSSTRNAFESSAKLVMKAVDFKLLEDENYIVEEINRDKVAIDLKLSNINYEEVNVLLKDNKKVIVIRGQGKWAGLVAYGTFQTLSIYSSEEFSELMPVITISGNNPVDVGFGDVYIDSGATAVDGNGVDLTGNITETNNVDTSVLGTYTVVYKVFNDLGNEGVATRTVNVVDLTPPVITMLGSSPISVNLGSTYTDAGATALDNVDGNITANIQSESTVNPDAAGTYTVTYNVSDSSDNAANPVIRTVNVVIVPPTNPGAFTNPNGDIVKGSTITVSWGNTSSWGIPVTGSNYRLEVQYNDGTWIIVDNTETISSKSHTVSSTHNTIRYRVRAENSNLSSEWVYSNIYDLIFPPITMSDGQLCGNNFMDIRDDKTYATVQIGEQCWFKENLRYTTSTCLTASWINNSPFACRLNGGYGWDKDEVLYQWGAAMNWDGVSPVDPVELEGTQGLCPVGWKIPTDGEMTTLTNYLSSDSQYWCGGSSNAIGKAFASTFNWTTSATTCAVGRTTSTNNSSGFTGLPVGHRTNTGSLNLVGTYGLWWSSSPSGSNALRRSLRSDDTTVSRAAFHPAYGYSIRCLLEQ